MPHATPAQLNTRLKRTIPVAQAEQALAEASGAVDAYVGYSLTQVANYVYTLSGNDRPFVYLPRRFTAVASVALDGVALAAGDWTFDLESRRLTRAVGRWYVGSTLTIAGTSGYAAGLVPQVAQSVTLSVAGRVLENPTGGLRSESLGDHAMTWAGDDPTGGAYLTDAEKAMLDEAGLRDIVI